MDKSLDDIKRDLKYSPSLTAVLTVFVTILFSLQPEGAVLKYGLAIEVAFAEPWRFLSSHFVHSGASHFLMNLLGLVFFGGILENAGVKKKKILKGILAAMIFSDLFVLASQTIRSTIVVGFSGVVYGFIGMMVSVLGWRLVLGLSILFFAFGIMTSGSNIAWSGHIGGFVGGALIMEEKI